MIIKFGQYTVSNLPRVYIAHPLRGDAVNNIARATAICQRLADERKVIPFSPLHCFGYLNPETADAHHAMALCFGLLGSADELWVYGEWWKSEGCRAEIEFAANRNMPIRFMEGRR